MLRLCLLLLAVGAGLAGCVSDQVGTDFASVSQKIGPPRAGQSRVVFLQDKRQGLSMALCACEVKLDGTPLGKVIAGKYAYADRPAGRHELLVTEALFPGDTKREIVMESGRTQFYLIKSSPRHDAATGGAVLGGLIGLAAVSVATAGEANPGPAELVPLDEATARTKLAELQAVD
ncbi:DUF2846 domain-containing protein [Bradyrhizobium commune]|uniref:DUF2846 domain-containing protein n=1 Tax=Bradyrhizobium commune TaxID=83627 RepID=A0A7S9DBU1_9BRAD|nr:DUF2846 domain-containing protein [Bradyrhizobium commune]QPF94826.1 DUF2846 domain-containing protein [Bradyrhizobium commune]